MEKIYIYDVIEYEKGYFKEIEEALAEKGEYQLLFTEQSLTVETAELAVGCAAVSVIGYSKVNEAVLEKLAALGISHLSTRTIGMDHIDVDKAERLGISVDNASYHPNNVADFTVMLMLILLRKAKISICRALVNDFSLDSLMGRELRSLTVGIIGTGKIGSTVIKNLSGFGCRILAVDGYHNPAVEGLAEYVDLDTLYGESDIISLHIPMLKENYHMIDKTAIGKMKDGVILINTARGGLIDADDLIDALEKEKVGGAGIDTVEDEDGIMHVAVGTKIIEKRNLLYLKQFPNVVFTQHYAFYTEEAAKSMVECGVYTLIQRMENKERTL